MSIHGIDSSGSLPGSDRTHHTQRADSSGRPESAKEERVAGHDRAEISSEARELARLADSSTAHAAPTRSLDTAHIRTMMIRMAEGFYDTPEVQLEIANKIRSTGHEPMSGADQF